MTLIARLIAALLWRRGGRCRSSQLVMRLRNDLVEITYGAVSFWSVYFYNGLWFIYCLWFLLFFYLCILYTQFAHNDSLTFINNFLHVIWHLHSLFNHSRICVFNPLTWSGQSEQISIYNSIIYYIIANIQKTAGMLFTTCRKLSVFSEKLSNRNWDVLTGIFLWYISLHHHPFDSSLMMSKADAAGEYDTKFDASVHNNLPPFPRLSRDTSLYT